MSAPPVEQEELFDLDYAPEWCDDEAMFLDNEHRYTKMHRLLRRHYGPLRGRRIIDLGCCRGQMLERFRRYSDVEVEGLEIDPAEIRLARRRGLDPVRAYVNRFRGNRMVAELPFGSEQADVVIAGEILEHVVDTDGFLAEIRRVLKPGGAVVLSTPNVVSLKSRIQVLLGRYPDCLDYHVRYGEDFGHVRAFSPAIVKELLVAARFREVVVVGQRLGPVSALRGPGAAWLDQLAERWTSLSEHTIALGRR